MNPVLNTEQLRAHGERAARLGIRGLVDGDRQRVTDFSLRVGPIYANFARQSYDRKAWTYLLSLAESAQLPLAFRRLFDGEEVNVTEQRAALHTALRSDLSTAPAARDAHRQALDARQRMMALVDALENSSVTDIVSVGIGGSDLGPRLVADALTGGLSTRLSVHFVSNVDGAAVQRTLRPLDPRRTAAVFISKTFSTQETLLNGAIVRDWLGGSERLYAVSAHPDKAAAQFDIAPAHVLPMWDWVGGRYSLWSTVGFPIALAIGNERFEQLLEGAAEMDAHVLDAPPSENLAHWHALTAIWNRNGMHLPSHVVLPYDQRLTLLPAYLQQLVMESLGKRVTVDGNPVDGDTVPVWWGGVGTDVQHSFFQALHQGSRLAAADFIGVIRNDDPYTDNHRALLSNLLAQSEAFANGQGGDDPHRFYPGDRPNTMLLLDALTPRSLGALLALYEHSVYAQSIVWGINAFDQFGVELGKQVANRLLPALSETVEASEWDPVTASLLRMMRQS